MNRDVGTGDDPRERDRSGEPRLGLRGSVLMSGLIHVVAFVALLLASGTGGARVIYKPDYQVRLVRPEEVPGLEKQAEPEAPPPAVPPKPEPEPEPEEQSKVILPEKEEPPPPPVETPPAPKPPPPESRVEPPAEPEAPPEPPVEVAEPEPEPEPVPEPDTDKALEEALSRIRERAGKREQKTASVTKGPSAGWQEKRREIQYRAYYDEVERRVRESWIPPRNFDLGDSVITTVVSLSLLADGRVLKSFVEESSGDPLFDQSVMRAILKATPFPPPPIGLKRQSFELGLRFHSRPHNP